MSASPQLSFDERAFGPAQDEPLRNVGDLSRAAHAEQLRSSVRRSTSRGLTALAAFLIAALALTQPAFAHAIGGKDAAFVANTTGPDPFPFLYLGAKHMVTGYDHLLFLAGVIFFLYRLKDVLIYVSLFSAGHSATLLIGVLSNVHVSPFLVDAVIGLSVSYKAFENLGGFRTMGFEPNPKAAVFIFGLVHGLGLATKLQELHLKPNGLLVNLISFNVGVEIGQLIALSMILGVIVLWRTTRSFGRLATAANALLFLAGIVLAGDQIAGLFLPKVAP